MILNITGQRSSAVEQRTHKPLVTGSNPVAATSYSHWAGFEGSLAIYKIIDKVYILYILVWSRLIKSHREEGILIK